MAWTTNQDWHQPIKREVCGRISDRFISCSYPKPCPVHDSPQDRSAIGAGGRPLSVSPAPRFFDEFTNQHRALAMHKRKEGP